jgi:hypothetical protein
MAMFFGLRAINVPFQHKSLKLDNLGILFKGGEATTLTTNTYTSDNVTLKISDYLIIYILKKVWAMERVCVWDMDRVCVWDMDRVCV